MELSLAGRTSHDHARGKPYRSRDTAAPGRSAATAPARRTHPRPLSMIRWP